MRQARAVGRNAGALKYDILTALMVLGAQDAGASGRLARRLALLITARFNWPRGTFSSGQREIARLWGVTERTAKREIAAMRALNWIVVRRPAARGRVAEHAVNLDVVLDATRPYWQAVGPDFVARMAATPQEAPEETGNIVPFATRGGAGGGAPPADDGSLWIMASRLLWENDAALHSAWFEALAETGRSDRVLELTAPSRFTAHYIETHFAGRLLAAVSRCDPAITRVIVRAEA